MKVVLLLLPLLFFTVQAHGEDKYIYSPVASYHMDHSRHYCQINPGVEYQAFINDTVFYNVGAFRNSLCNIAVNALVGYESFKHKQFLGIPYGYGIMGGFTTGYNSRVIVAPYIRLGDREDRWNIKVLVLPYPKESVFGIGIAYKIGNK